MENGFQELLEEFLLEARERSDEVETQLLALARADADAAAVALARLKRELHTLKGNAGMMGFADLQQIAHEMEDQVEGLDLETPEISDLLANLDAMRRGLEDVSAEATGTTVMEASGLGSGGSGSGGSGSSGPGSSGPGAAATRPGVAPSDDRESGRSTGSGSMSGLDDDADDPSAGVAPIGASARRGAGSVRVPFSKIDQMVEIQAEILIFRTRLVNAIEQAQSAVEQALGRGEVGKASARAAAEMLQGVESARQELDKALDQLQDQVTELGMVPLQSLFRSLGRIVHDESRREGKQVELEIEGGDTPIDKTLLETAGDALGHLVRNAVVHGIEAPRERRLRGKPAVGTVWVGAEIAAGQVRITVRDDGGGIDTDELRAQAREVVGTEAEHLSDTALLFQAGVSTRGSTDLAAGRGVGLSAVERSVERHGGRILVESQVGRGSVFSLLLPVTTAILRSLLLRVGQEDFALALSTIGETLQLEERSHHEVGGARVVRWRGGLVPLLDLGRLFGLREVSASEGFVVVVEVNGRRRGLVVDSILGLRDIVVKGLDPIVGRPPGIFGSTILGDGRVVMILDAGALVSLPPTASRGEADARANRSAGDLPAGDSALPSDLSSTSRPPSNR